MSGKSTDQNKVLQKNVAFYNTYWEPLKRLFYLANFILGICPKHNTTNTALPQ